MLGPRAHCDSHSPGQRANIEALVRWQSQAGAHAAGRLAPLAASAESGRADETWRALRQLLPPAAALPGATTGAVRLLDRSLLDWQAPLPNEPALCLGSMRLWPALSEEVEWIDLVLSVHQGGRWWALQVVVDDDASGEAAAPRSRIVLDADADAATALLELGLEPAALAAAAAGAGTTCWVCREDGLGVFVAGLIDLGWPAA
jgi:hypothetical protein